MITALLLATLNAAGLACSAESELARAASAYRNTRPKSYRQYIEVQVPGAPKHEEQLDFGFDHENVVMSMPSLYTIELRRNRFRIAEEGRHDAYVSAPAGDDLQGSLDTAFGGAGSPVIPPTVLLRRARTADERKQAFRLKVMGKLGRATCNDGEVTLAADNGTVRFRVEKHGLIREIHARITTAPGQPDIEANLKLVPGEGDRPVFTARGRAVSNVAQLTESERIEVMPDIALRTLDGTEVRLRGTDGRTTVVEFWATWCVPCRATLPRLAEFARSRRDVRVLLVNLSEDAGRIRSYLAAARIDLPTLIDASGSLHQNFGGGLPLTVVISADGRVLKRHAGFDPDIAVWLRGNTSEREP
jgi:thiol-disulfide isomerase/thioredoxin